MGSTATTAPIAGARGYMPALTVLSAFLVRAREDPAASACFDPGAPASSYGVASARADQKPLAAGVWAPLTCFLSFSRARGEAERGTPRLVAELFCFDKAAVATSGARRPTYGVIVFRRRRDRSA